MKTVQAPEGERKEAAIAELHSVLVDGLTRSVHAALESHIELQNHPSRQLVQAILADTPCPTWSRDKKGRIKFAQPFSGLRDSVVFLSRLRAAGFTAKYKFGNVIIDDRK
jgi:sulfite reductase alpha subunit-like flavoprotein